MIGFFFSKALSLAVSFVYPCYSSLKAIKTESPDDDKQWLTFWIVFSFYSVLESFCDKFLWIVPMYYELKIALMLWLQLPQFQGAKYIYLQFVEPLMAKYEKHIDEKLDQVKNSVQQQAKEYGQKAQEAILQAASKATSDALSAAINSKSDSPNSIAAALLASASNAVASAPVLEAKNEEASPVPMSNEKVEKYSPVLVNSDLKSEEID